MTNKITQLVNESGDNLYPLAGGMAADSINTQMLKDGSVTSDKIDWATINAYNATSEYTFTPNSTYVNDCSVVVFKRGPMIDARVTIEFKAVSGAVNYRKLLDGLPTPGSNHSFPTFLLQSNDSLSENGVQPIFVQLDTGGHLYFKNIKSISAGQKIIVSMVYFGS